MNRNWTLLLSALSMAGLLACSGEDCDFQGPVAGQWVPICIGDADETSEALFDVLSTPDALFVTAESGIHRSTDGGRSFRRVGPGHPMDRIVADPADPRHLLATASNWGGNYPAGWIYKSFDAGLSWQQIRIRAVIQDLAFDPTRPQRVYAVASTTLGDETEDGLFLSEDGGNVWQRLTTESVGELAAVGPDGTFHTQASLPFDNEQFILFLGGRRLLVGAIEGLLLSEDAGRSWTTMDPGFQRASGCSVGYYHAAQAPDEPDELFLAVNETGMMRSRDGGRTWSAIYQPGADFPPANPCYHPGRMSFSASDPRLLYVVDDDRVGVFQR